MHTERKESVSLLGEASLRRRLVLSLAAACVIGAGATAHAELPSIIELTLPQIQATRPTLGYDWQFGRTRTDWTGEHFVAAIYRDLSRAK